MSANYTLDDFDHIEPYASPLFVGLVRPYLFHPEVPMPYYYSARTMGDPVPYDAFTLSETDMNLGPGQYKILIFAQKPFSDPTLRESWAVAVTKSFEIVDPNLIN